jgi:hypothetical protein
MADFCSSCTGDGIWWEYYYWKERWKASGSVECESGSWEWYTSQSYAPYVLDSGGDRKVLRMAYGFDLTHSVQTEWNLMLCEGCSREGVPFGCIVDSYGYCCDPLCNKHGEINKAKGWSVELIDNDIEKIGNITHISWKQENI